MAGRSLLTPPSERAEGPDRALRLIAVFKFAKVALLLVVGLGALELLDPEIMLRAQRWTDAVATGTDRRLVQLLLGHILGLTPGRLEILAAGAFMYSALFATEGTGLWLGRRWAEYLTVVATLSFLPVELLALLQRVSAIRAGALLLNIAVAAYLIFRLKRNVRPKPSLAPDSRPAA